MEIWYHPKFARMYKKLPPEVKRQAEKSEELFRNDPFDSRLKTHKLAGELLGFWSFSINYQYRIIFDFENESTVRFYLVGTHDDVYR